MTSFEGTEKKLELLLNKNHNLRSFDKQFFKELVEKSGARILSHISNSYLDAYLLSESSMFVFNDSLVIITCGDTCILDSFDFFLTKIDPTNIKHLFYERKNPMFPTKQKYTFDEDAKRLNKIVQGSAYLFGSQNENHICLFCNKTDTPLKHMNCTLEILMHNLSKKTVSEFNRKKIDHLGLETLLGEFKTDSHYFNPIGYSLNAIKDKEYYTIHVTPDDPCSYASFETNYYFKSKLDYQKLIDKILEIFSPSSFDIVQFQPKNSPELNEKVYNNKSKVRHKLESDCLVEFYNFFKLDKFFANPSKITI